MVKITNEGCKLVTVTANVLADLAGKEGYVVEQVAASEKVQLYTNGIPYAVLVERLQGSDQWSAALIQGGGLCGCVANGAIDSPGYVKAANGGKVTAASSTNQCIGTKRYPTASSADGDRIMVDLGLVVMP